MSQIPPLEPPGVSPSYGGFALQSACDSWYAITSLACGILGCVLFVSSIFFIGTGGWSVFTGIVAILATVSAIVAAFFAMRATRNPAMRWQGLAIAGIILGCVAVAGWCAVGALWSIIGPERIQAHPSLIDDFKNGNWTAAAGIIAIVTGIAALGTTRNPMVRRRGLAIAGLILGIVGLCGWSAVGLLGKISRPEQKLAHRFFDDLNKDNASAAVGECTQKVSAAQLSDAVKQLKDWGGITATTVNDVNITTNNDATSGSASGDISTPRGTHQFQLQTVESQSGVWRINSFALK